MAPGSRRWRRGSSGGVVATTSSAAPVRVIVPILDGTDEIAALELAAALAGDGGHLVIVAIVVLRRGEDIPTATTAARSLRGRLRVLERSLPRTVSAETLVRAADSVGNGIRQVAE